MAKKSFLGTALGLALFTGVTLKLAEKLTNTQKKKKKRSRSSKMILEAIP